MKYNGTAEEIFYRQVVTELEDIAYQLTMIEESQLSPRVQVAAMALQGILASGISYTAQQAAQNAIWATDELFAHLDHGETGRAER